MTKRTRIPIEGSIGSRKMPAVEPRYGEHGRLPQRPMMPRAERRLAKARARADFKNG